MSSIYKKGRDGYYYYQTYIYNSDTGKKDKRIFHSLSTKDVSEAEHKKRELDCKYELNTHPVSSSNSNSFFIRKKYIFISILVISVIAILFSNLTKSKSKFKKTTLTQAGIIEKTNINTSAVNELLTDDIAILEKTNGDSLILEKKEPNLIIEKELSFNIQQTKIDCLELLSKQKSESLRRDERSLWYKMHRIVRNSRISRT